MNPDAFSSRIFTEEGRPGGSGDRSHQDLAGQQLVEVPRPSTTRTNPVARPGDAGTPKVMACSERTAPTIVGAASHTRRRNGF